MSKDTEWLAVGAMMDISVPVVRIPRESDQPAGIGQRGLNNAEMLHLIWDVLGPDSSIELEAPTFYACSHAGPGDRAQKWEPQEGWILL